MSAEDFQRLKLASLPERRTVEFGSLKGFYFTKMN